MELLELVFALTGFGPFRCREMLGAVAVSLVPLPVATLHLLLRGSDSFGLRY